MLSVADIASIKTSRGTLLIGPLASFGREAPEVVLRYPDDIRRVIDHLFREWPDGAVIRPFLRRWGLDPNAAIRSDRAAFPRWLVDQAVNGALGVAEAPDPILAFVAYADRQQDMQKIVAAAWSAKQGNAPQRGSSSSSSPAAMAGAMRPPAIGPDGEEPLPVGIEERFLIVLSMVPDHLSGETLAAFRSLDPVALSSSLLIWVGLHFVPGLDLAVLAFDLFFLSDQVIGAIREIAGGIGQIQAATTRAQLRPVARRVAGALAILIVNAALERFMRAAKVTHGFREGAGPVTKPNPPKREPRRVARQPPPEAGDGGGPAPKQAPQALSSGKGGYHPKKTGQREAAAVERTPELQRELEDGRLIAARGEPMTADGYPPLSADKRATFRQDPQPVTLKEGDKLYRVVGSDESAAGSYWTLEPPPRTENEWRGASAVQNNWNGDGKYVEYTVAEREQVKGWFGPARAQEASDGKGVLRGSGNQFVLPDPKVLDKAALSTPRPTPWNR